MLRKLRVDVGGQFYHVLNRANARMQIFFKDEDYKLLYMIMLEAKYRFDMRILVYSLMPNHFHLLLWPQQDGDVQKFMHLVMLKHTQLWHKEHKTVGTGHLYQGRYKSFLIEGEKHLLTEMLYMERNQVQAGLVKKATDWKFSSARYRLGEEDKLITSPPIDLPPNYLELINQKKDTPSKFFNGA